MILITEFMDERAVAGLRDRHETVYDPQLVDKPEELAGRLSGVEALIVRNRTRVDEALLARADALRCVGRLGVGLDNIDLESCKRRGITVFPATGANNLSVAEYVITAALMLLRGAWQANPAMLAGAWPRQDCIGDEIAGKTLGLIGYGAIAREAARLAGGLGMTVLAHDPFVADDDPAWQHAGRRQLDVLLAESDVISVHVPATPATRHLIDSGALLQMKTGAIVINTARGGIVDEAALCDALQAGRLGGAALDVFETEPLDAAAAAEFRDIPNVILTPHIAGVTRQSNVRVSALIADLVLDHLAD